MNPYFTWPNTAKTTNQLDVSKDYPQTSLYKVVNMSRVEQVANVNTFSGKYIFIGESGTAIHDMIDSPAIGMQITGVDGHAHFLDGLIQNKMLARAPDNIMFTVFILLSLLLSCLYFFVPKYLSQILAISSFVSIIWVSRYLYDAQRVLVDFMPLFLS